jgi:hypothetical protein
MEIEHMIDINEVEDKLKDQQEAYRLAAQRLQQEQAAHGDAQQQLFNAVQEIQRRAGIEKEMKEAYENVTARADEQGALYAQADDQRRRRPTSERHGRSGVEFATTSDPSHGPLEDSTATDCSCRVREDRS